MTKPDTELQARLAEFAKSDCRDNDFAKWCQTAWQAYSSGQLITRAEAETMVMAERGYWTDGAIRMLPESKYLDLMIIVSELREVASAIRARGEKP